MAIMTRKKRRRLAFAIALLVASIGGAALVIAALKDNVLYFYSPSDVAGKGVRPGIAFHIGGLVARGSVKRGVGGEVRFTVTDGRAQVPVTYTGALPDLFREGQGVVALGTQGRDGVFNASEVLAKHDEKYMPPEVVDALKRSGHWQEGGTGPS
jgi:cytochrome c-type biogenesis protein CcmE